jgi:tetratricopeptide (TPR) repeat protein
MDLEKAEEIYRSVSTDPTKPTQRDFSSAQLAQVSLVKGRTREALRNYHEASLIATRQSETRMPALRASFDSALVRIFFLGDIAGGREQVRRALAAIPMESLPASERLWTYLIRIFQESGDAAGARSALQSFERDYPQMGVEQGMGIGLTEARGMAAMAAGRAAEAIEFFREADRTYYACYRCSMINLARAFDLAGQRDSAITWFQRFVDAPHGFLDEDQDWLAGSYKRLGELYEASGDLPKAVTNLEKFIELWKDADPELQPKVRDARSRLDRIREELARRG